MTEEMKKLRDKLAKEESEYLVNTLDQELADYCVRLGFDACYKEMQAQADELKREEIARQKTFALGHTEIYIRSLEEQLKSKDAQLDVAVKALSIVAFLKSKVHWVAPNNRDELRTLLNQGEQALTKIKEVGSTNETKYSEESK